MAPLGILTAVVSVIRVCGNSSLRAFIGRAQEGPGEAENELLSCVSETTAEMFNNGGISRVFGRPRLLEIIAWEETDPQTKERSYRIGTLRDALREGAWLAGKGSWILDEKEYLPELDIPNLSLNKGIEKSSQGWFYAAAVLGLGLQVGELTLVRLWYCMWPMLTNHVRGHCIRCNNCIPLPSTIQERRKPCRQLCFSAVFPWVYLSLHRNVPVRLHH